MAQRTNNSALDAYMEAVGRIPMLTPQEEIHLGKMVKRLMVLKKLDRPLTRKEKGEVIRGERAKARFIQANLRLVVYIAARGNRKGSFLESLDLIQEATIGLIRAVEMFDPARGYKFSTYAYWWCRQAISRSRAFQERAIRRPSSVNEMASKVQKVAQQKASELGRQLSLDELAEATGVKRSELELLSTRGSHCVSLDLMACNSETSSTYLELLKDENLPTVDENYEALDTSHQIERMLAGLPELSELERNFVVRRYGLDGNEPASYADLAREIKVSRERARQITATALSKLRYHLSHTPERTVTSAPVGVVEAIPELPAPRACDQIDPEVLEAAREAWATPA